MEIPSDPQDLRPPWNFQGPPVIILIQIVMIILFSLLQRNLIRESRLFSSHTWTPRLILMMMMMMMMVMMMVMMLTMICSRSTYPMLTTPLP